MIEVIPVQVAVLQALEKGDTLSHICKRAGWIGTDGKAETSRLQRSIGLKPVNNGHYCNRMYIGNAIQIIEAIGRDPVEFGL